MKEYPKKVIIQLPTGPILVATIAARALTGISAELIADVHTGFLTSKIRFIFKGWRHNILNAPFKEFTKYVDLILLHNKLNKVLLPREYHNKSIVLYDPFYVLKEFISKFRGCELTYSGPRDYVVFPASWHPDEPIEFLISTWVRHGLDLPLLITGMPRGPVTIRASKLLRENRKVVLTGYLSYDRYLCLLSKAKAVISATTSNLDMQCSAYEALALKRPIIASKSQAIREVLKDSASYFTINNPTSLIKSVKEVINEYETYVGKIHRISSELEGKIRKIIDIIMK